jgi:ABC-type iron transport system FetAB permease component
VRQTLDQSHDHQSSEEELKVEGHILLKREHTMLAMIFPGIYLQYLFECSAILFILLFIINALFIIHKQGINYVYFQPIR